MKKNVRIVSVLLMIVLATSIVFTGCGKKGSDKTLEDCLSKKPDYQAELDAMLAEQGVQGTMEITGNDIVMNVDMTEQLSSIGNLTDEMKDAIKTSLDSSAKGSKETMAKQIQALEEETGVKGITLQIKMSYNDEVIHEYTFTSKA